MKAAVVQGPGQHPVCGSFAAPEIAGGEVRVTVTAAALCPLTRIRAAGTHYSAAGPYPLVAGVDGVGRLDDGSRVYFLLPRAPFGSMAEVAPVAHNLCIPVPDGLDDVAAAAFANPGMSSWAAFTARAKLKHGETVLINGATGASGRLAVQIARHLGAGRVIATGRNTAVLRELEALGADATLELSGDRAELTEKFRAHFSAGVDVVIDYLWGESAECLLTAATKGAKEGVPLRFVQVGSSGGAEIRLPASVLRSSGLEMTGSGIGSVPKAGLLAAISGVFGLAASGGLSLPLRTLPLSEVAAAWQDDGRAGRIVLVP